MTDKKGALLKANLAKSAKAASWLAKSLHKCQALNVSTPIDETSFDTLENLTSRFARHSDILFQKVFRLIDQIELEPQPSLLDTLNCAAKRGFLNDKTLKEIREIRNAIADEYAEEDLVTLFREALKLAPKLLEVQATVETYCKKFKELN